VLRAVVLRDGRAVRTPAAERDAVAALWEASSRRLRAWFRSRTRSESDADDLVQETFLRVQARLGLLRERGRLDAWVSAIAANLLADHGRRRARRPLPLTDEDAVAAPAEVARELGLSPSGARSRVQRARARLRRKLEACCRFGFDARGNLLEARRRTGQACDCGPGESGV
jgi:RNA polymerase sigma-70 factor (ECF subfamily)